MKTIKSKNVVPTIVVDNLTKKYGKQVAVNDISFTINKGEIVGFIGPNGAGKSTTMKIIVSYLSPDSGKVIINGHKLESETREIKKSIGYLPENNPLYEDMAVVDYLKFCADIQGVDKEEVPQRIKSMIRLCGL